MWARRQVTTGQSLLCTGTTNLVVEMEQFMNDGPAVTLRPSGINGISTARDLARMYQLLARGGELDGVRLLSEEAVKKGRHPSVRRGRRVLWYAGAVGPRFRAAGELRNELRTGGLRLRDA